MSLADFLSQPTGGFDVVPGFAEAYPNIRVGGLVQPAVWLGDYALPGEPVIVGVIRKPDAPGQCLMLGRVGGPLPLEGIVTAAPPGSDTITVTAGTTDYTVTFNANMTPVAGVTRVRLLWQGGTGTAICEVGVTPEANIDPPPTAAPPGAATNGSLSVIAADSGTYSGSVYGWNSYYGQSVFQGDGSPWGAPPSNSGSWFYGSGAGQLVGATVTDGIKFRLPARKSGGASSAAATVHIHLHTSPTRPGGDVTRIAGPVDVAIPPGYGGGWLGLPVSWGPDLVAGGGISITGSPYMGFKGRSEDPESGQLILPWTR